MKHLTKALALIMALACCLIAFGMNTFALDGCPAHPNDYWEGKEGKYLNGVYYHNCYCGTCGELFAVRECLMYNQHDCTTSIECLVCGQKQIGYEQHASHSFTAWQYTSEYHYKTCTCDDCLVEERWSHTYIDRHRRNYISSLHNVWLQQSQGLTIFILSCAYMTQERKFSPN